MIQNDDSSEPSTARSGPVPIPFVKPKAYGPVVGLVGVVLVVIFGLVAFRSEVSTAYKGYQIEKIVRQMHDSIAAKDWLKTAELLREGRLLDPGHSSLLRVTADFFDETGIEPAAQLQTLRQLREAGDVQETDLLKEGRAHLRVGDVAQAQAALRSLAPHLQESAAGLTLKASILAQQGQHERAQETRQIASQQPSEDEAADFRRLFHELSSPVAEKQALVLAELWKMSSRQDASGLEALRFLIERDGLKPAQVRELRAAFEKHPHHDLADRLSATSALMRVEPGSRAQLLDEEVQRNEGKGLEATVSLARWLAHEKEHDRLMRLIPPALSLTSKELFPIALQSLAETGRWKEMRGWLEKPRGLPMKEESLHVWKALVASHLDADSTQVINHLKLAINGGKSERNYATLRAAAQVAEDLKLWDVAYAGYESLIGQEVGHEQEMLEKCWQMALSMGDLDHQLETARRLHLLRPTSFRFATRFDYLRLLLGDELESTASAQATEKDMTEQDQANEVLLQALKAYRFGDQARVKVILSQLGDAGQLPPGQRAVCAGLLAINGETAKAFQIAERIQTSLITKEERRFLEKAL